MALCKISSCNIIKRRIMAKKRYPIGIQTFDKIRTEDRLYIDKTEYVYRMTHSDSNYIFLGRPRRFGKSFAAQMLCAYYDKSCDSHSLFADLQIAHTEHYKTYLNKFPVIYLDMTTFARHYTDQDVVQLIERKVKNDVLDAYPGVVVEEYATLMECLGKITVAHGEKFFLIIDEWDAICRENENGIPIVDDYVNWLRTLFKDVQATNIFAGVYMTGILPVKKYKTESALNNFTEYSMVMPRNMAGYFGFTKSEVAELAEKHHFSFDDLVKWYDGYQIGAEPSVFNPNSVMQALYSDWCESYWASTGAYDAVAGYINMNYDGLKDDIIKMLAGGRAKVDPTGFQNDLSLIRNRDDVLTVLIHLGYLSYDRTRQECYIPNREVAGEMVNAVKSNQWEPVIKALEQSEHLLQATLDGDEEAVARGVDVAHDEHTSILSYNDENSLACVLSIAYYYAKNDYIMHRELASGKGFADIVLIPRKNVDSPAIVLELKYNQDADTAICQIKRKQYPAKVSDYTDNLLLVGINYDKQQKKHECRIERYKHE